MQSNNTSSFLTRKVGVVALGLMFIVVPHGFAMAGTSDCQSIKNSDKRNYCMAVVTHKSSYCGYINDHDLRHMCYVVTTS